MEPQGTRLKSPGLFISFTTHTENMNTVFYLWVCIVFEIVSNRSEPNFEWRSLRLELCSFNCIPEYPSCSITCIANLITPVLTGSTFAFAFLFLVTKFFLLRPPKQRTLHISLLMIVANYSILSLFLYENFLKRAPRQCLTPVSCANFLCHTQEDCVQHQWTTDCSILGKLKHNRLQAYWAMIFFYWCYSLR